MKQLIPPPLASSATIGDLISSEKLREMDRKGDEPLTPENARQVLTGCYLTMSHRFESSPVCVMDFRKLSNQPKPRG